MNRIKLSPAVMDYIWEHWMRVRTDSYSLAAIQYHIDKGWDLEYHSDSLSYTLPEHQYTFFVLSL